MEDQPFDTKNTDRSTHWAWYAVAGDAMIALGVYAMTHVMVATAASILMVGAMMVVAGIVQIVVAARTRGMSGAALWALGGILYIVAGILAVSNPVLTSALITIILAVTLVASGVFRIMFGLDVRPDPGWNWIVVAGAISAIVGGLIVIGWPGTIWVLGLILAVDIFGQGAAILMPALMARPYP